MILELAQHVQKFLHAHNQPPAPSFYEEMMSNKRKQEQHQEAERQKKIDLLKRKEEKQVWYYEYKCTVKLEAQCVEISSCVRKLYYILLYTCVSKYVFSVSRLRKKYISVRKR